MSIKRSLVLAVVSSCLSIGAFAGPAYRAGWTGAFNYQGSKWSYTSDNATYTIPEMGVFTGPVAATNNCNAYVWGLKGFWAPASTWYHRTAWGGFRYWRFTGQMYFDGGSYYFGENLNMALEFKIDGNRLWENGDANTFTCKNCSPSEGWHDVELRMTCQDDVPAGANGTGKEGFLLGFGYVQSSSAPSAMNDLYYPRDNGSGAFLRNVNPGDFFTVDSFTFAAGVCTVEIKAAAAMPEGASAKLYLGSAASVAENGSESTWSVGGSEVTIQPGETKQVSANWSGDGVPYFAVKVSGMMDSLDCGYVNGDETSGNRVAGGPRLAFWQWSDPVKAVVAPMISASFAGVSGTSADFDVTLGYKVASSGVMPDIAVTAYYGPTDAGTEAGDWSANHPFGEMAAGEYDLSLPGLTSGESYWVRLAVKTADSDLVWSDPMFVSLAGITLSGIDGPIFENYPAARMFSVNRPANTVDESLTVRLAYGGATDRVSALPDSVTMPAGQASVVVSFTAIDNAELDGDGVITVEIVPDSKYVVGSPSSMQATVLDDESNGAEITWTGNAGDNLWTTAGNWNPQRVPGAMDVANFVYNGQFGDGDARSVTVPSESVVGCVKVATGDALTLKGVGPLVVGGIDRGTAGWPWGVVDLQVPLTVFSGVGGTNVWNTGKTDIALGTDVATVGTVVIRKIGSGKLYLRKSNQAFNGRMHVAEGSLLFEQGKGQSKALKGTLDIGGEETKAVAQIASKDYQDAFKDTSIDINVYNNGTLDLEPNSAVAGVRNTKIYAGGTVKIPWYDPQTVTIYGGGQLLRAGHWSGICRPNSSAGLSSKADDAAAIADVSFEPQVWNDFDISVEDGSAAVDLVLDKLGDSAYGAYSKGPYTKSGSGTLKITGECTSKRGLTIKAGTVLADNDTASCSTSNVTVNANATLGGIGRISCRQFDGSACVTAPVVVNGTVAPGSYDTVTGDPIVGTLKIGGGENVNDIQFNGSSRLYAKFAAERVCNRLEVSGSMAISGSSTQLVLASDDVSAVKSGEYVIATAAGGIEGEFASIVLPEGVTASHWRVAYDDDRIVVTVLGDGHFLIFR